MLVVLGHTIAGLCDAGLLNPRGEWAELKYIIYTFHMPVFFIIAGMMAQQSRLLGSPRFVARQARRTLYPFLLWGAIQVMIMGAMSHFTNQAHVFGWQSMKELLGGERGPVLVFGGPLFHTCALLPIQPLCQQHGIPDSLRGTARLRRTLHVSCAAGANLQLCPVLCVWRFCR